MIPRVVKPTGNTQPESRAADDHGALQEPEVQHEVGVRLRDVRTRLGLTLAQVEADSDGLWKATAVGAYERGERALSLPRLLGLARFYGVPAEQLLPKDPAQVEPVRTGSQVVLDLEALPLLPSPDGDIMHRYVTMLQALRADWTTRHMPVRRDDLPVLAAAYGTSVSELLDRLTDWGLALPPAGPSTTPHGKPV